MSLENDFLRSGELARLAGVSADTLRHYERKGVLSRPRRAENGYRQYPADAPQRVRLVRSAIAVGFTLDELANILCVRDSGGVPCEEVRAMAARKLSIIELQLREMIALRKELRTILQDWDSRLARRVPGARASLLESLAAGHAKKPRPRDVFRVHVNQKQKRRRS